MSVCFAVSNFSLRKTTDWNFVNHYLNQIKSNTKLAYICRAYLWKSL